MPLHSVFVSFFLPPTAVFPCSSSTSGLSSLVTLFHSATKQQLIKDLFCFLTSSTNFTFYLYKKGPQIETCFEHFEILKRSCRIRIALCLKAQDKYNVKLSLKRFVGSHRVARQVPTFSINRFTDGDDDLRLTRRPPYIHYKILGTLLDYDIR
jgi:hypothetical protein